MPLDRFQSRLEAAIESKKVTHTTHQPRTTKADVLDYYKAEYGKAGTRKAAEALAVSGLVTNKETGVTPKIESLMRRFQSRGGKSQAETSAVYAALGKDLPAKAIHTRVMPSTYTISISGKQGTGDGGTRNRSWSYTFSGVEAYAFAQDPSYRAFFYSLKYPLDVVDRFENGDYELEVSEVS